ncbi:MAG: DUF192 domain-containing protein [Sphingomonadales bacterium]
MTGKLARRLAAIVVLGCWCSAAVAEVPEGGIAQSLPLQPLTVETQAGERDLQVQVADTDATRQTGLMYRVSMPEAEGMLFIFQQVRPVSFWMKNTMLPLDIIFVGDDGRVINIARNTTPFSLASIPSRGPARAVLELNAGASRRLGIDVGDRVRYEALALPHGERSP